MVSQSRDRADEERAREGAVSGDLDPMAELVAATEEWGGYDAEFEGAQ